MRNTYYIIRFSTSFGARFILLCTHSPCHALWKIDSLTKCSQYHSESLQSSFLHYTYDTATRYAFSTLSTRLPITDVTVHDLVRLTLLPQLTSSLDGRFSAVLFQVIVSHNFTTNKFVLEVGAVDDNELYPISLTGVTYWMTPAAWGALIPFRTVHARTSSGPQVKYRIKSRLA